MNGSRGADSILTFVGDVSTHLLDIDPRLALQLEHAWNEATRSLRFLTVCAYSTPRFENADARTFPQLCAEHVAVTQLSEGGTRSLTP